MLPKRKKYQIFIIVVHNKIQINLPIVLPKKYINLLMVKIIITFFIFLN